MQNSAPQPRTSLAGCPLLDETPGTFRPGLGTFTWPDGTATAVSWLPCGGVQEPILPGTCGFCVSPPVGAGRLGQSAFGGEPGDLTTAD